MSDVFTCYWCNRTMPFTQQGENRGTVLGDGWHHTVNGRDCCRRCYNTDSPYTRCYTDQTSEGYEVTRVRKTFGAEQPDAPKT